MAILKTARQQAEEASRDIRYFESKFNAKIQDSKEYNQYVIQRPDFGYGWDQMSYEDSNRVVPMKCVHLPAEKLEELIKEQEYISYIEKRSEHALKVLQMLRADEHVRDINPAVQKAYRNYLTLLELARK